MSDADRAYEIAEQRIERARAEGHEYLCLAEESDTTFGANWGRDKNLNNLTRIPDSISSLREVTRLDLDGTQVADITPLAGMVGMQTLDLTGTQVADVTPLAEQGTLRFLALDNTPIADLSSLGLKEAMRVISFSNTQVADLAPLGAMAELRRLDLSNTRVKDLSPIWGLKALEQIDLSKTDVDLLTLIAPGMAWETENRDLSDIHFKDVPVEDAALADIGRRSAEKTVGSETLARLRELRDMAPSPASAKGPVPTGPFTFLSYAHTDRPAARRLKSALEAEGLSIWWDQMIDPGMDWDAELRRRVKSAHSVLVLWSEASAASEHVRDEAQRARRANTIAPVMIEPLSEDQLPLAFPRRQTLDLSHWDGARDDEVFQRLVSFLKLRQIGAKSPVTTRFNDDGLLELAERPVGVAPLREDEMRRSRLLRAQADLSRDLAGVIEEELGANLSNSDKRLIMRIRGYESALRSDEDLIWETLDAAHQRANGLVRADELDDGMAPTVALWRKQHDDLQEFIQPAQAPGDEAPDDQVSPDDVGEVVEELAEVAAELEAAASTETDAAPVTAPVPRLLQSHAERLARERDDPDGPSEASEQAGRSRTGKAVRAALGVLTGVAAGVTVHTWAVTGPGAPLLNKMVALAKKLFALL